MVEDQTTLMWLAAEEDCDVQLRIVAHAADSQRQDVQQQLLPGSPAGCSSSSTCGLAGAALIVHVSSYLLSRIPYFAASLSEPWLLGSSCGLHLTVECCAACVSPQDYLLCLQFLKPVHELKSVDMALKVLPPADHLLFQECTDECMQFLAAVPWSETDYHSIREAVTSMQGLIKPSPDVAAKLELNHNFLIDIFKDIVMAAVAEPPEVALTDSTLFKDTLQKVARISPSTLIEAWISISRRLNSYRTRARALWIALTRALLQYGDAEELIQGFASCSTALAKNCCLDGEVGEVVRQLFAKAIDSGARTMSTLQCSTVAVAWAPLVAGRLDSDQDLGLAFAQISLPHLLQAWISLTKIDHMWLACARILLQFGDSKEVLQAFALKSKDFAAATYFTDLEMTADIMEKFFLRLVPGNQTFAPLSNSQRASIVEAWVPLVNRLKYFPGVTLAFEKVFCSLPPHDPVVLHLVKTHQSDQFFKPCFAYWINSLHKNLKELNQMENR